MFYLPPTYTNLYPYQADQLFTKLVTCCRCLSRNASSVISGVRLLKRLMECNPTAIYWGYLEERAQKLRVSFYSAEDSCRPVRRRLFS